MAVSTTISTGITTPLGFESLKILEKPKEHFSVVTAAQVLCAGNTFWFLLSSAFRKAGALLGTNQMSQKIPAPETLAHFKWQILWNGIFPSGCSSHRGF